MRESIGKAVARKYFYEDCLPRWLSKDELRTGNFLLLLGEKPRELEYIDRYGATRSQIFSVERDAYVYNLQLQQKLVVHLWEGELVSHLGDLLHRNDDFLVFNLDIEGSYLSQLDQGITPALLYSWRNPQTVIATYSSVGRDTEMLWEGVKSLVIFLWLCRAETLTAFGSLKERYKEARFDSPALMTLRDFFWLRSMLEHSLVTSVMMGTTAPEVVQRWFGKMDILWNSVTRWRRNPLQLNGLLSALNIFIADSRNSSQVYEPPSCIGSVISDLRHVVYNAMHPWSQLCYFAKFEVLGELIPCREWLANGLRMFVKNPLMYVNRLGRSRELFYVSPKHERSNEQVVIWKGTDIYDSFVPRRLPIFPTSSRLVEVSRTSLTQKGLGVSFLNGKGKGAVMQHFVDKRGDLTEFGKRQIQKSAREWRDLSTEDMVKLFPKSVQLLPRRVVSAHIAVGRRRK